MLNREWLIIPLSKKESIPILDLSPRISGNTNTQIYLDNLEIKISNFTEYIISTTEKRDEEINISERISEEAE